MTTPQWARQPVPTLETQRLVLSQPVVADREAIARLANNLAVTRWLRQLPFPYTAQDADFFLCEIVPVQAVWAIRAVSDDAFMGVIGLTPTRPGRAELGYWLGKPFWANGYATEAATVALGAAHRHFGLGTIWSGYFEGNEASANVLRKLGFRKTGTTTSECASIGRDVTLVLMECSAA